MHQGPVGADDHHIIRGLSAQYRMTGEIRYISIWIRHGVAIIYSARKGCEGHQNPSYWPENDHLGPLLLTWINSILACIIDYIRCNVWD